MTIIDPGHEYGLESLDGDFPQILTFVKREGEKYPGNVGHHPGTTTQEALRACIHRLRYVNKQLQSDYTSQVISILIQAVWLLEVRAAHQHEREINFNLGDVVAGKEKCCLKCGHVGCEGKCH